MAQIVIIGVGTWSVIDGFERRTGLLNRHSIPETNCPVVDTALISEDDAEALSKIIRSYIKPSGCVNVPEMLGELEKLGAVVVYPSVLSVAEASSHV